MDLYLALALAFLSFILGIRVAYALLIESQRMRKLTQTQQDEINTVLKKVNSLMHSKKVKKITIKREKK